MFLKKVFIHIPKNAGMTIRRSPMLSKVVMPAGVKVHKSEKYSQAVLAHMNKIGDHHGFEHARWRDCKRSLVEAHSSFAIIRNPWDRVASRYFFAKKVIEVEQKEPVGKHPIDSFEEFLEDRHKWGGVEYMWHRAIRGWYNQLDYVWDPVQEMIKPDILRFENLDNEVRKYFGITKKLDPRNVTAVNTGTYKDIYTPETIQIVADWYKDDIDMFGFDFDTGATKNTWSTQ